MRVILSLIFAVLISCNEIHDNKYKALHDQTSQDPTTSIGSDREEYVKNIQEKERASIKSGIDNLGEVIDNITFHVKTDNRKDYENGIIPWVSIEKAEKDLPDLVDRDKTVISEKDVMIIIDYPLTTEYKFKLFSKDGFTREKLLREIRKHYYLLYEEEEKTATVKTIPLEKRIIHNRNETNGKYGIWGHDISDLVLVEIIVHKTSSGDILLSLDIGS